MDIFLKVLSIIAIILAGGFVVMFLGNIFLTVWDNAKNKDTKEENKQITYDYSREIHNTNNYNNEKVEDQKYLNNIDYDAAERERKMLGASDEEEFSNFHNDDEEDIFAKLRKEEEAFKAERQKNIDERNNALHDNDSKNKEFDKFFFDEEDEDFKDGKLDFEEDEDEDDDDFFANFNTELDSEKLEQQVDAQIEDEKEDYDNAEAFKDQLDSIQEEAEDQLENRISNEEFEELQKQLEEYKELADKYKKQAEDAEKELENVENAEPFDISDANLTLEEYEDRLALLIQRLKDNEKALKPIKKEYLPLNRVRKSLENDKKKLRRKEALVAKQKVVLYGVNNYGDIDDEKAQKLAEDLDLLDGLKVSVAHCEEVIEANKERIPVLENAYTVLTKTSTTIKEDIEECKAKIAELKGEQE